MRLRARDCYTSKHSHWWKKGELVQVRFTLRLRDHWSMRMQDRREVYMASNGSYFMVTWIILKKSPLGGRVNTKPGDHGTLNAHNCWFILFYQVWGPSWLEIHWNNIRLRARSHVTSHCMILEVVLGQPLDTFLWALTISWSRLLARVWRQP